MLSGLVYGPKPRIKRVRNVKRNVVQTVHSRNKPQSVPLSMFRALSHTAPPCERTALVPFPHTLGDSGSRVLDPMSKQQRQ